MSKNKKFSNKYFDILFLLIAIILTEKNNSGNDF